MSLQPLMRRKERCASIMPAPTQRRTMAGSRQRLTPEETRRTVEIIDSMALVHDKRSGEPVGGPEPAHGEHVVEPFAQARPRQRGARARAGRRGPWPP